VSKPELSDDFLEEEYVTDKLDLSVRVNCKKYLKKIKPFTVIKIK
jgi:hypothetical protein